MKNQDSDFDDQNSQAEAGEEERPAGNSPREIDATAMKAFAHPLRMAMYDYLNDHGSATATMLAKHTGESTGQTSYHLRQLERHGFVEDDPTRGTGRERWWKSVGFAMRGLDMTKDSSARPAVASMLRHQVQQRAALLSDWFDRSETEDKDWAEISTNNRYTLVLTQEEADEMRNRAVSLFEEFVGKSRKKSTASPDEMEGTRRVRVYLDAFSLPEDD